MDPSSREHCLPSLICLGSYLALKSLAEWACLREKHFVAQTTYLGGEAVWLLRLKLPISATIPLIFFSMILRSWEECDDFLSALTALQKLVVLPWSDVFGLVVHRWNKSCMTLSCYLLSSSTGYQSTASHSQWQLFVKECKNKENIQQHVPYHLSFWILEIWNLETLQTQGLHGVLWVKYSLIWSSWSETSQSF